jgi:hypothetical protein
MASSPAQENIHSLAAKIYAGKDWHTLSSDEQVLVNLLERIGSLNPVRNGFVGKVFENSPDLNYVGAFSIELVDGARMDHVPAFVLISGNTITVRNGSVKQETGSIQLYADDVPFSWWYSYMKKIYKEDGDLLWVNNRRI